MATGGREVPLVSRWSVRMNTLHDLQAVVGLLGCPLGLSCLQTPGPFFPNLFGDPLPLPMDLGPLPLFESLSPSPSGPWSGCPPQPWLQSDFAPSRIRALASLLAQGNRWIFKMIQARLFSTCELNILGVGWGGVQDRDVLPEVAMPPPQALGEQQRSWGWPGVWAPQSHGPGLLPVLVLSTGVASGRGLEHGLTGTIHAPQGCDDGQGDFW